MLVLEPVLVSPWGKSLQISGALGWTRNFHEFSGFCLLPGVVCGLTLGSCISEHRRINACLKTSSGVRLESCLQLDLGYLGIKKNWPKIIFLYFSQVLCKFCRRQTRPDGQGCWPQWSWPCFEGRQTSCPGCKVAANQKKLLHITVQLYLYIYISIIP